ncbi:hypothetical protein QVD99_005502 [Batrachochytrium dendrobatidis]|nr:hypothetical protein O5D80_004165 [Batrachochytrium dendrobatidis]KAK5668484.1 hypothetical protein QVD99_005502 [Batrachochytrium dendrobatidis]
MDVKLTPLGDATAGTIGAIFANVLVFPLDVVKTRLQVQTDTLKASKSNHGYKNAVDALLKIYKSEGLQGLYAGMGSGLFGTVVSSFSYFYIYGHVRGEYLKRIGNKEVGTAMELILGATAGALCQIFVLPIAVVTTRQQTDPDSKGISFIEIFKTIVAEDGPQGLWKGLKASLVLCANPAITYGVFERFKSILIKQKGGSSSSLTTLEVFVIGALSKTLATIVTYPYIMAKARLQWKPPKEVDGLSEKDQEKLRYKSSFDVLRKVYREKGFKGWYTGMRTQIIKAVLCQAILFSSKQRLGIYTLILFSFFNQKHSVPIQITQK